MIRCYTCRKQRDELDTIWDRIRGWFFNKFHEDIIDLSQAKYTQGYGDGYKAGWDRYKTLEATDEANALRTDYFQPLGTDSCKPSETK